jgi:hypothetical protein
MKLAMTNIADNLKVAQLVIQPIPIFVVNNLALFKLPAKVLFHDPSVFVRPRPRRGDFDGDVGAIGSFPQSFGEHGKGTRMVHALQFGGLAKKALFGVPTDSEAFFALKGIFIGWAIDSAAWGNRLATNTTRFDFRWFHNLSYTPAQTYCQG